MKKLIIILLLLPAFLNAQQLIDQKDPFTGKEVKGAIVLFGGLLKPSGQTLSFIVEKDVKYISYMWNSPSGSFGAFSNINIEETSLMIKLENDSIMIFKADKDQSKIINSGAQSILVISSPITNTQLKTLSERIISVFRVGLKDTNGVDVDKALFTNKNRDQVKKAAAHIL